MMTTLAAIARIAFLESLRQPIYVVMLLIAGLFQVLSTWMAAFSMGFRSVPGDVTGDAKLLFDVGLATVFVCGLFLASFIATSVLSREIERKTVLTVVSKPVGRASVVLGKFLGVAAAMTVAVVIMLVMLLFALRHGVLSTASDTLDWPVLIFGVGSLALSLALAAVGNYLFGWNFAQAAVMLLFPMILVAYVVTLGISPKWELQPLSADFLPQVTKACLAIAVALVVLAAVATAASTRLGQVMTITVCAGVFALGLLNNYFFGRFAFDNSIAGRIREARTEDGRTIFELASRPGLELARGRLEAWARARGEEPGAIVPEDEFTPNRAANLDLITAWEALALAPRQTMAERRDLFLTPGATYTVELEGPPAEPIQVGDAFYYGPSPNGLGMATPAFPDPSGRTDLALSRWAPDVPGAIVVTAVDDLTLTVRQVGGSAVPVERPPLPGDHVFLRPTTLNPAPLAMWAMLPNMQVFWLSDAVSQAVDIPWSHLGLIAVYGLAQVAVYLSAAVLLFQGRDVG